MSSESNKICVLSNGLEIYNGRSDNIKIKAATEFFGIHEITCYKLYSKILCSMMDKLKSQINKYKQQNINDEIQTLEEHIDEIKTFTQEFSLYTNYLITTMNNFTDSLNVKRIQKTNGAYEYVVQIQHNEDQVKELYEQYKQDSNFHNLPETIKAINRLPVSIVKDLILDKIQFTDETFCKHYISGESIGEFMNLFKFYYFHLAGFNYKKFKDALFEDEDLEIKYAQTYSTKKAEAFVLRFIENKQYLQDILNILIIDGWIIIKDLWSTARIKPPRIIENINTIKVRERAKTFSGGGQLDIITIIIAALVIILIMIAYEYLSKSMKFETYKPYKHHRKYRNYGY